jgi:hypothetical protein
VGQTKTLWSTAIAVGAIALLVVSIVQASAHVAGNDSFKQAWSRTDAPVADVSVARTWMWGPEAFTGILEEDYLESPSNRRVVQYFDKSRMEITSDPNVSKDSPWYVTNGLLVRELITGRMQVGDTAFEIQHAAAINVAGDPDDASGPTYFTFQRLLKVPPVNDNADLILRIDRTGQPIADASLAGRGVIAAHRVQVLGIDHQVASPFWEFMNSTGVVVENGETTVGRLFQNPFYATGYPITEAYWTTVRVAKTPHELLVQCFERRCLTYTPENAEGWRVEAGNVGRHYYAWRYGNDIVDPTPTAIASSTPQPSTTMTLSPTWTQSPATATATATATQKSPTPSLTATAVTWPHIDHPAAYLDPETAILAACGCNPSNPLGAPIVKRAYTARHQFHLATAPLGSFNRDTTEFYDWLEFYVDWFSGGSGGGEFNNFFDRMNDQAWTAIYSPNSQIGEQLRRLEAGSDESYNQFGSGPEVYWTYAVDPAVVLVLDPIYYDAARRHFDRQVADYWSAHYSDPSAYPDFGTYLASIGYTAGGILHP